MYFDESVTNYEFAIVSYVHDAPLWVEAEWLGEKWVASMCNQHFGAHLGVGWGINGLRLV